MSNSPQQQPFNRPISSNEVNTTINRLDFWPSRDLQPSTITTSGHKKTGISMVSDLENIRNCLEQNTDYGVQKILGSTQQVINLNLKPDPNPMSVDVCRRLQDKADMISKGIYRGPKQVTVMSLHEKAGKIRQERLLREMQLDCDVGRKENSVAVLSQQNFDAITSDNLFKSMRPKHIEFPDTMQARNPNTSESEDYLAKSTTTRGDSKSSSSDKLATRYSAAEVYEYYLEQLDINGYTEIVQKQIEEAKINSPIKRNCWSFFKSLFFSREQDDNLRMRLLALAKVRPTSSQDYFVLRVIWRELTDRPYETYGSHWFEVGFNARNPVNDFKEAGSLGLLQLYYFLNKHREYFLESYKSAMNHHHPYQFVQVFIKATQTYIRLLTQGKIKGFCFQQYADVYCAIVYHIFQTLGSQKQSESDPLTIVDEELSRVSANLRKVKKSYSRAMAH